MDINHLIIIVFLILCSTIIAIYSIIYDYKNTRKLEGSNEYYLSRRITRIHRNYIIGFLSLGIISLITALYGNDSNSNIFTYISFASTITSFVLSILAIFVTMQSNFRLEKQLTKIDTATNSISELSENLDSTLSQVNDVSIDIKCSTQKLLEVTNSILPQLKETLDNSLSHHEYNIVQKLKASVPNDTKQEDSSGVDLDKIKKYFLSRMSPSGLAGIYTCTLSYEKNKSFRNDELFQYGAEYNYGIIISTVSIGFIEIKTKDRGNDILCTYSAFTSEQIYDGIKFHINRNELGISYLNLINQIRSFFDLTEVEIEVKRSQD